LKTENNKQRVAKNTLLSGTGKYRQIAQAVFDYKGYPRCLSNFKFAVFDDKGYPAF